MLARDGQSPDVHKMGCVEIVRSRLVGRDFKMKGGGQPEFFFAATPPWEAKKLLFKMSMVNPKRGKLETKS